MSDAIRARNLVLGVLGLVLLTQLPARATTFVLMDERDLAARSVAVVTGWVTRIAAVSDGASGAIHTYVFILPDEVVAGDVPAGELALREVGGSAGGRTEFVYGSPTYSVGENVLVFLSQDVDGALHTTAMAMGKYGLEFDARGVPAAVRALGPGVAVLDPGSGELLTEVAAERTDLDEFIARIKAAPLGADLMPPVPELPAELDALQPEGWQGEFAFLGSPSRWFEPDSGAPVPYLVDSTGDAKLGPSASRAAVDDALAAWSGIATSNLSLVDGGLTSPEAFGGCAGPNRVVFNDPFGEITDPTGCGGVLAIGGYCTSAETRTVNGTSFRRIMLGKVTFNNGFESCSSWTACNVAEVVTHELGHTIGLGHSPDNDATMRSSAHFDGRCAALRADDVAGAEFIYPLVGSPLPSRTATATPTATRTPTQPPPPTATPTRTATSTAPPAENQNLALGKSATQSSTAFGGGASRAADGVTNGNWSSGSVSHTGNDAQAWWQVDLGAVAPIASIDVWNRTDCCGSRLAAFYVFVSDLPFAATDVAATVSQTGVSSYYTAGAAGTQATVAVSRTGRYVRVQLTGTNYLSLAEVQVWAGAGGPPPAASPTATRTPTSAAPVVTVTPTRTPTSAAPAATVTATRTAAVPPPTATPTSASGGAGVNRALGRSATQSSTAFGGGAQRAVDGVTTGGWESGSVTHTGKDYEPWWQVDLGEAVPIASIDVWNRTDCCGARLSAFYLLVSDAAFASTSLTATLSQSGVSAYYVPGTAGSPTGVAVGRTGRYVRVQLTGSEYLSLAEVQVWQSEAPSPPAATATPTLPFTSTPTPTRTATSGTVPSATPAAAVNLAQGMAATQCSTAFGGLAQRAVDGVSDGNWSNGSVTHTGNDPQAWWEVDLGAVGSIDRVDVWNRVDCCSTRLGRFYVFVSDAPFESADANATWAQSGVSSYYSAATAGTPTIVAVNRSGRYVRIQLADTNYLSLAEVQVWGRAASSGSAVAPVPGSRGHRRDGTRWR